NQPLTAINLYTRGCLRRLRPSAQNNADLIHTMEKVAAQAEHAGMIIRRLRNFVRKREPQPTAADINSLVRDVLGLAESEIRMSETRVRLYLAADLPAVRADPIQIEQVLLNLVR